MISRSHFRKSLTARKFIFMRRTLEPFALMMILQMKPDRSHPHEIIFKSSLSRVEFEEQPVGLQIAFKLKASAALQSKVTARRCISASTAPQTNEI